MLRGFCISFPRPGRLWRLLLCCGAPLCADAPSEVTYFPSAVFRGEPLTLQVSAAPAARVQLFRGDAVSQELTPSPDPAVSREISLLPEQSEILGIGSGGDIHWRFAVVRPDTAEAFKEIDGYLHSGNLPAILLPDHRLPPPLDRRWETVTRVGQALQPEKKPLPSLDFLGAGSDEVADWFRGRWGEDRFRLWAPDPAAWFRVHGALRVRPPKPAPFLVVRMEVHDLERGMPVGEWLMKWQFVLQYWQQGGGGTDGVLLGPRYTPETRRWQPLLEEKLGGLARAHGLRFVNLSLPEAVWRERLLNQLAREYQLP